MNIPERRSPEMDYEGNKNERGEHMDQGRSRGLGRGVRTQVLTQYQSTSQTTLFRNSVTESSHLIIIDYSSL
jgi:hypothetical protein